MTLTDNDDHRSSDSADSRQPAPLNLSQRAGRTIAQPISFLMQQALANPNMVSLAAGLVDNETLPVDATHEALESLLGDKTIGRKMLQYGATNGDPRLRQLIVERSLQQDGVTAEAINAPYDTDNYESGAIEYLQDGDVVARVDFSGTTARISRQR